MKDKTGRTAMDLIPSVSAKDTADVVTLRDREGESDSEETGGFIVCFHCIRGTSLLFCLHLCKAVVVVEVLDCSCSSDSDHAPQS